MTDPLVVYMRIYCHFLAVDLFNSLTPKGREHGIIYDFYKTFLVLNTKGKTLSQKKSSINELYEIVKEYTDLYASNDYHKHLSDALVCSNIKLNNTFKGEFTRLTAEKVIKEYSKATELFLRLSKTEEFDGSIPYIKNSSCPEKIHRQSIIEFNNGLSHLYKAYSCEEKAVENISRAIVHLHRGTLDLYKTLILHKKSLSSGEKIDLVNLRLIEIGTIGDDVEESLHLKENESKGTLIDKYKELVERLYKLNN